MDLIQGMNVISLVDEEERGLEIEQSVGDVTGLQIQGFDPKLCVVGRFISEGKVDFMAMQHTMATLWKPGRGVYMKELDLNLYLFQFYHELDVKRVMEGCPWSFNRCALVMARLKQGENPRNIDLNAMDIWVQVHDLRPGFINQIKPIGAKWLRNGMNVGDSSSGKEKHVVNSDRDDVNQDPQNSPIIVESGDLNNVLSHADKKGGRPYPSQLIQGFRDVIEDYNLSDMDLIGYPFTWERGSTAADRIEVRLDRALISANFQNMFPEAKLYNLEVSTSDHCPILLDLHSTIFGFQTKSFRFENAWLREPMCQRIVEDVWSSGRRDDESLATLREEQKKLSEIYAQQEVFWRQRSKQLWLREGDRNNKFFHASMKNRRAFNHIKSLKNSEGQEVQWNNGLEEVITGYFSSLFQAFNMEWAEIVQCIDRKITTAQNDMLLSPVSDVEVKQALFHMHPEKSPGPDGMTPGFYQKIWNILSADVIKVVRQFFDTGVLDEKLIATNIALIPKKRNPQSMKDLRPISLCNVLYKVISKVLANRLKKIIDAIISDTQSAFIPGRLISDNIMIAHELMYSMKRKTTGKQGWMALKIDMSKAYDRVEWDFLATVLIKLGFDHKVVSMYMACISSVTYQVAHVGKVFGSIIPSRGIRQGDPLSSYLFLICIEGLTSFIHSYERRGLLQGIRVAHSAPSISHIFFADDCYIFCKADVTCAGHVQDMLQTFEQASGQQINIDKSLVIFNKNVSNNLKDSLCEHLGFKEAGEDCLYLGLPSFLHKKKIVAFGYIKEKLQDKLQDAATGKSIHWMSWERMSNRKSEGGMGFRSVHEFNVALLGTKQWDVDLVRDIFDDRDSNLILSIPLWDDNEDNWIAAALPVITGEYQSFGDWLQLVFEQCDNSSVIVSVMLCWMLWKNRNDLVWTQKCLTAMEVMQSALSVLNQWQFVQDKSFDNSLDFILPEEGQATWQAPSCNKIKINTDAVLFSNLNRYSHAQVVRDHNGELVEAMSKCSRGLVNPEAVEAMGIREALSWVKQKQQHDVIVETDCLVMVQWIRSSYAALSYLGRLIDECRQLLVDLQDKNVMLRFVKRFANNVAHYLVCYNSSLADRSAETLQQLLSFLKAGSINELNAVYAHLIDVVFADGFFPPEASHRADFENKAEEARSIVNSWVKEKTYGLIKDILSPGSVNELTKLILANALYFKGEWIFPFNASSSKHFDFHLLDSSSVQVPFMTTNKRQFISVFNGFKVLELPYQRGQSQNQEERQSFSMRILLPHARDGLPALVKKVGSESGFLDRHVPNRRVKVGEFRIPKFKFEYSIEAY
ncbi:hypothetical protein AgCh_016437 [Apium graveolens]